MKQIRIFCFLVTSVFVGGSGAAFGYEAACATLDDNDLILTLPCVSTSDGKTWSATLHPVPSPDPNDPYISTWTLVDGSIKRASFDPGNNNCASYNAGGSLAVPCGLYLGIRNILQFEANLPVFELKSIYPDVKTPESFVVRLYVVKDIGEIYSTEEGQLIQINGLEVNYYKTFSGRNFGWWGPGYYISSNQSQGEDLDSKNFTFRLTPSSFSDPILGIKGKYYALDSHGKVAYADFL
jgi:hypothetical protein